MTVHLSPTTSGSAATTAGQISTSTTAGLPAAGTAGRLRAVTDGVRGVYRDTGSRWLREGLAVNVLEYGADPSNTNDSASAFQTAVDAIHAAGGGTLYVPAGTYRINTGILVPTADASSSINVIGDGADATQIRWYGANTGVLWSQYRAHHVLMRGIKFANLSAGGRGTTKGLWVTAQTGTGTRTNVNIYEDLAFDGFNHGLHVGSISPDVAGSELHFRQCKWDNCDYGAWTENTNSLDIYFEGANLSSNGVGLELQVYNVQVIGGSATGNTTADIHCTGNGLTVIGYRSEACTRLVWHEPAGHGGVTIMGCQATDDGSSDGILVELGSTRITLIDNYLSQGVAIKNFGNGMATFIGNEIVDTQLFRVFGGTGTYPGTNYGLVGGLAFSAGNANAGGTLTNGWLYPDQAGALVPMLTLATGQDAARGVAGSIQLGASVAYSSITKTASYTLAAIDSTVLADTTGAACTLTLPTAVGCLGRRYTVKRITATANNATVATTSSQTIDGATTYVLSAQYKFVTVESDGANWQIVGAN